MMVGFGAGGDYGIAVFRLAKEAATTGRNDHIMEQCRLLAKKFDETPVKVFHDVERVFIREFE